MIQTLNASFEKQLDKKEKGHEQELAKLQKEREKDQQEVAKREKELLRRISDL